MVTKPMREEEQELVAALKELREAYQEYQRRFRYEPLSDKDVEPLPYEDLEAITRRYESAEERYRAALKRVGRLVPYHPGFDEEGFGSHRLRSLRGPKIEPAEILEGTQYVTDTLGPDADWMLKTWLLNGRIPSFELSTLKRALQFDEAHRRPTNDQAFYGQFLTPSIFAIESRSRWWLSVGAIKTQSVSGRIQGKVVQPDHAEAFTAHQTGALVWRGLLPEDRMGHPGSLWMESALLTIHQLVTIAGVYWHRLMGEGEVVLSIAVHGLEGRRLLRLEPSAEIGSTSKRTMFEYRGQINALDLYTNVLRLGLQISEMLFESFDWRAHSELRKLQRRAITLAS